MHFRRTATEDTEVRGQRIRAGDKVVVWYVSRDFDDRAVRRPVPLEATRRPTTMSRSGSTSPHCAFGSHLARLEMRVLFEELMPMLDRNRGRRHPRCGCGRTSSRASKRLEVAASWRPLATWRSAPAAVAGCHLVGRGADLGRAGHDGPQRHGRRPPSV